MSIFKAAVLAATLFFASNVSSQDTVTVDTAQICDFFAEDAIDLGLLRASGAGKEDLAEWIGERIKRDPIFLTFLPGDLLIAEILMKVEMTDQSVETFAEVTHEMCMENITSGFWIQEVPGHSKIVRSKDPQKVQM